MNLPDPRDPRDMPGPTEDEKIQVFEARHLVGSLITLAVVLIALAWWTFRK